MEESFHSSGGKNATPWTWTETKYTMICRKKIHRDRASVTSFRSSAENIKAGMMEWMDTAGRKRHTVDHGDTWKRHHESQLLKVQRFRPALNVNSWSACRRKTNPDSNGSLPVFAVLRTDTDDQHASKLLNILNFHCICLKTGALIRQRKCDWGPSNINKCHNFWSKTEPYVTPLS